MAWVAVAMMVVKGMSQIQNARYQANLIDAQSRAAQDKAAFDQNTLEIESEKERLNRAILANEKLMGAKKVMGQNIASEAASGLVFSGNVFQTVSLRNLSNELNVIHLEEALITQQLKGQQAQLTLKTEFDKRMAKAEEKQIRWAGYHEGAQSFAKAYAMGKGGGGGGHQDSGSSATYSRGYYTSGGGSTAGNAAPIYNTSGTYSPTTYSAYKPIGRSPYNSNWRK